MSIDNTRFDEKYFDQALFDAKTTGNYYIDTWILVLYRGYHAVASARKYIAWVKSRGFRALQN